MRVLPATAVVLTTALASTASAGLVSLQIKIENLAPDLGTWQTPFWVGFHNGNFDYFDVGDPASSELERLAEDGTVDPLRALFAGSGKGAQDHVISSGPEFAPGAIETLMITLDNEDPLARYFSYGSMVIPSNDAFIGNDNATAHQVFNDAGDFLGVDFFVTGNDILDAGTEENTEIPAHTAFFGQTVPDTGNPEGGVVHDHPGYLGSLGKGGSPMILADPMFVGADFTIPGYPVARITITQIPAPGAFALLGLAGLCGHRRRRS